MKRANEVLVGAAVLGAVITVVVGSVWLSQRRFGRADQLASARFRNIGYLQTGGPVLLRGVRIGRVEWIELAEGNWVNVGFRLRGDARLPESPAALIASTTLFGDWGVDIQSTDALPDDPEILRQVAEGQRAGDDRWPGATLPDIGQLTQQAGRIAGDIASIASRFGTAFDSASAVRLQLAFRDLSNLSQRLSQIATRQRDNLDRIGVNLDTGTAALARAAGALERTLRRADSASSREQLQRILSQTDTISGELAQVAANLRGVSGAAASQAQSLSRIIANTDSILARIEAGQGTLGRLTRDTTLYSQSVQVVGQLRELLQDIRANPRRYFTFSVF